MKSTFLCVVLISNIFYVFAEEAMYQFEIKSDKENIKLNDTFTINFYIKNISSVERRLNAYSFVYKPRLLDFFYESGNNIVTLDFCIAQTVLYRMPDNPFIVLKPRNEFEFSLEITYKYIESIDMRTLQVYKGNALVVGPVFIPISAEIDKVLVTTELEDADNILLRSNRINLRLDNNISTDMEREGDGIKVQNANL
jgi:hypothetical protein